jgi:hypothetical protein
MAVAQALSRMCMTPSILDARTGGLYRPGRVLYSRFSGKSDEISNLVKQAVAYFFLSLVLGTAAFTAQQHVPAFPQTGATRLQDGRLLTVWDVQRHKGQPTGFERHELDEVAVTLSRAIWLEFK